MGIFRAQIGHLCLAVFVSLSVAATAWGSRTISRVCAPNQECLVDLPGAICADGTPSYFTLLKRPGSRNLLVFLTGGGACWSRETCSNRFARPLTRVEQYTEWSRGHGIYSTQDPGNPFAKDYDIVTVPYCTGDVFVGDADVDYGGGMVLHHHGYRNVQLALEAVHKLYPEPEKAVLMGCSAGGIGSYFHMKDFVETFPKARKYVISDAGTPFTPPYLTQSRYNAIFDRWGVNKTVPEPDIHDLGAVIRYNTQHFPDVRFGLISSLYDRVMTFFALAIGTEHPFEAVQLSIDNAADVEIGRDAASAKVFFTSTGSHCQAGYPLNSVTSQGTDLGTWLTEMINDERGWQNQRADLEPRALTP